MRRLEVSYTLGAMDVLVSLARYNFVVRTINDRHVQVLDFGCGSGYGTKVLRERFHNVTAYDEYPDGYHGSDDVSVINKLSDLHNQKFDVITCFEVIEHMDAAAQEALMDTLHGLLTPTGSLYISTVRKMDPPPTENRRIYHVRELSFEELYDMCSARFQNVYTFGQIDQVISTFYKENHYHFVFLCTARR